MSMFELFNKKNKVSGEIGYFGLSEWWLSEFTNEERNYILKKFQPLGSDENSLVDGDISYTSQTALGFLSGLVSWFDNEKDRKIAYRILRKAEELIDETCNIIDVHFHYQNKLKIYYKDRDKDINALNQAIEACKKQIEIAKEVKTAFLKEFDNDPLPGHVGFEQLAIIEEKHKNFESAINISKTALEQGWAGDWQKRIDRCTKKLIS